jgi:SAM-dependent methyltransferase
MVEVVENTPVAWSRRAASAASSHKAAGWTERGQAQRFLAVLRHLDLRAGQDLLDYGCGTGRFSTFLPLGIGYFGYDTAPGMLERAKAEHPDGSYLAELGAGWIYDHIVCVGPFNLPGSREETWEILSGLWEQHLPSTLIASLYDGKDERCLTYDPDWALSLARSLSQKYVIDRSYLGNDVLMVVKR